MDVFGLMVVKAVVSVIEDVIEVCGLDEEEEEVSKGWL